MTDQESVDWATANLGVVGWSVGKHTGAKEEQREAHPITMLAQGKDPFDRS